MTMTTSLLVTTGGKSACPCSVASSLSTARFKGQARPQKGANPNRGMCEHFAWCGSFYGMFNSTFNFYSVFNLEVTTIENSGF